MKFTIIEAGPGARRILRSGECQEIDLAAQVGESEAIFVGEAYSDATHSFVDGQPVENPSPLTDDEFAYQVNIERSRRILTGAVFGGVYLRGDGETSGNLKSLAFKAERRQRADDQTPIIYRDGINAVHQLSPDAFMAIYDAADAYVEQLYFKSWLLKAADPRPADVRDDALWPARTLPES